MDKELKEQHDQFLTLLRSVFKVKEEIKFEELLRYGKSIGITPVDTSIILDILTTKNVVGWKAIRVGGNITYYYTLKPKVSKFNSKGGGKKFRFYRHWAWFLLL